MTIAEAQRCLRVGRTKIYELAAEYRSSGGTAGLRVIELGTALRVPRVALEEMIGAPVHVPPPPTVDEPAGTEAAPPVFEVLTNPVPEPAPAPRSRKPSRQVPASQLDLFGPPAAS